MANSILELLAGKLTAYSDQGDGSVDRDEIKV